LLDFPQVWLEIFSGFFVGALFQPPKMNPGTAMVVITGCCFGAFVRAATGFGGSLLLPGSKKGGLGGCGWAVKPMRDLQGVTRC